MWNIADKIRSHQSQKSPSRGKEFSPLQNPFHSSTKKNVHEKGSRKKVLRCRATEFLFQKERSWEWRILPDARTRNFVPSTLFLIYSVGPAHILLLRETRRGLLTFCALKCLLFCSLGWQHCSSFNARWRRRWEEGIKQAGMMTGRRKEREEKRGGGAFKRIPNPGHQQQQQKQAQRCAFILFSSFGWWRRIAAPPEPGKKRCKNI